MIRYLGGKSRLSKKIAAIIEHNRKPGQVYLEPFCGGAWVLGQVSGERIASDINEALITYYRAVQQGYLPPDDISELEYKAIKSKMDIGDPVTAFAMLACSFCAVWGSSYARERSGCNFAARGKRSCIKNRGGIMGVSFESKSYLDYSPEGMIIYCDPPYANTDTGGYRANKGKFDSGLFWETMRDWSKNNTVIISEYVAPDDFKCIAEFPQHVSSVRSSKGREKITERLFKLDLTTYNN